MGQVLDFLAGNAGFSCPVYFYRHIRLLKAGAQYDASLQRQLSSPKAQWSARLSIYIKYSI